MSANLADVQSLLSNLRNAPVNTDGALDSILAPVYDHLMNVPSSSDGRFHWFCELAKPTTLEAATFLLRLFAYNSPRVEEWKKRFESCVTRCLGCVKGLGELKESSRSTYFGAFTDEVLDGFYRSFDEWELSIVTNSLSRAGVSLQETVTGQKSLADAPSIAVFHIVSNLAILQDSKIHSFIRQHPPPYPFPDWPSNPPPAGLLILMMDENPDTRLWAKSQSSLCRVVPIPMDHFHGPHRISVAAIAKALGSVNPDSSTTLPSDRVNRGTGIAVLETSFASNPVDLWAAFCSILRLIPPDSFTSAKYYHVDVRRIVTGHLHDVGPQFVDVFRCLLILLKRLGSTFWQGEGPDYPQIVFDAVKDNPSYTELIHNVQSVGDRPWFISWFSEYLSTIRDMPVYSEVLAKMIDFMCEELQHERFQEARPFIMVAAARLLSSVLRKVQQEDMLRHANAVSSVLDIHVDVFIAVAFARAYNDSMWKNARSAARELITNTLVKDVQDISLAVTELCRRLANHGRGTPWSATILSIRKQFWKKTYQTIQSNDSNGIAMMIRIVARSAHLDTLTRNAFSSAFQKQGGLCAIEAIFDEVNSSLAVVHDGFLDAMSKYANYNVSTSIRDLLRREGMVKDVMVLMLSPVEGIQVAAQTLVGQAFDVDVRLDCFRALLVNLPDVALDGIVSSMETFIQFATVVPEACSLSKSLVRCLTDVIEVLCSGIDGLLHNDRFLNPTGKPSPTAELPKLWHLMTKSIAVIFKRTPLWSTYFENEDMVVWMRDALIFGRDMLAQRRVIETASVEAEQPSSLQSSKPHKLSPAGKKMVVDLQEVLPELARWLRLTDEELLHQSFALLQSLLDCFRDSGIPPLEAGIAKLNKHIEDARKNDPGRPQTRLDATRLSKLEDALASFAEDDDDIQIVSHTTAPRQQLDRSTKAKPFQTKDSAGRVPSTDVKTKDLPVTRQSLSKSTASSVFSAKEKEKLDALSSVSSLRKPEVSQPSSKGIAQAKHRDFQPKNEGVSERREVRYSSTSGESGSDEGEESQVGLASLGKYQKSPKIRKATERRQVKVLDPPANARNLARDHFNRRDEARRTALRLKPDISRLHRTLLSWNYDHQGFEPPTSGEKTTLGRVPDEFSDHDHYLRTFEPLLLLECWAQILQAKDETHDSYMCTIASRQFINDWLDLDILISETLKKDWYLTETDVVLFRHVDGGKCILGKTLSYRATPHAVQATIRCLLRGGSGDPGLQINTTWRLSKVFSLSTLHREYAALMALPYYDLYQTILRPRLSRMTTVNHTYIQDVMANYDVNEPQAVAILTSLQVDGFSLIQGPPGTGKTSTICGLVQAFLSKRPRPTTSIVVGRNAGTASKEPLRKILLCAPSNAAVDEVANRVRNSGKRGPTPNVVRIGADKMINVGVKDISLDYLVDQRLNSSQTPSKGAEIEIQVLRGEIDSVKRLKQQKQEELSSLRDNTARVTALEDEIKVLNSRRMSLTQQFDRLKDKQKSDSRTLDATRRKYRVQILQEADVICSTLSGAGHEILEQFDFEMVVIDEAAQAIELSSLIPLKYRCRSCIMVGDPQQLPPTVLSREACKFKYDQSLFVRLQKHRPEAVHLLSIQYRMHPDISQLPSRLFYQQRLQDGPSMAVKTKQPWHTHSKFGTYRFFNVSRGQEEQGSHRSLKNDAECQVAVALFSRLQQEFSGFNFDFKVGVVSMYSAQVQELRRTFQTRFGSDILQKVHFHTVDGFQGQEKEVIILSCVRAGPGLQAIGFLADTRRMNVALTRAKSSLFILGNAPTLERSDDNWRAIVLDARTRSLLTDTDATYFTKQSVVPPRPRVVRVKPAKMVSSEQVIPAGLATPNEIKAAVSGGPTVPAPSRSPVAMSTIQNGQTSSSNNIPRAAQKRPSASDGPPFGDVQATNPRPPLTKRPKQAPSIFIPKGKKRPPPDGGSGPSNNKRRL